MLQHQKNNTKEVIMKKSLYLLYAAIILFPFAAMGDDQTYYPIYKVKQPVSVTNLHPAADHIQVICRLWNHGKLLRFAESSPLPVKGGSYSGAVVVMLQQDKPGTPDKITCSLRAYHNDEHYKVLTPTYQPGGYSYENIPVWAKATALSRVHSEYSLIGRN